MREAVTHRNLLFSRIKRCLLYAERFGTFKAISLLWRVLFGKGVISLDLPGYKSPVYARSGTSDLSTFEQVFLYCGYALNIEIKPKLIIDAGANVGHATVYFANRYPGAKIVAVEPEPSNYEMLLLNTKNYPNVKTIRAGLWHRKTYLELINPNAAKWVYQVKEARAPAADSIQAVTVDELSGMDPIDLFKCDVEGAEVEIFGNGCEWLERTSVVVIELHDRFRAGCSETFYRAALRHNFEYSTLLDSVVLKKLDQSSCRKFPNLSSALVTD